jgi:hypothetical protein
MFSDLIYKDYSISCKKFTVVLQEDFVYENEKYIITVNKGFDYDLASVPSIFQSIISKVGVYDCAATIHDWLYSSHALPRKESDKLFLQAMKEAGVSFMTRYSMYFAVSWFGYFAYKYTEDPIKYQTLGSIKVK